MGKRSIVYVDGFNLYYGAIRNTRYKWLDLQRLFERLRQGDDIEVIRYFTALIDGPHEVNQRAYVQALASCPEVEVILGRFKRKQIKCRVTGCQYTGDRIFTVLEEKRTDVAIAVTMLDDAYKGLAERFVVVSGDSDLVPGVAALKQNFPDREVIVYVPAGNAVRGAATEPRSAADKDRSLPMALMAHCQFPSRVPDGQGGWVEKPAGW